MSTPPDAVSRWPEHLPVGAVRVGRTSADHDQTVQFYRDLVGLPVLESFKESFGEDGTIFGLPDTASHLEIVRSPEPAVRSIASISGKNPACSSITRAPAPPFRSLGRKRLAPRGIASVIYLVRLRNSVRRPRPRNDRAFTVPRGTPRWVAISDWVKPPKYASTRTSRCSSGRRVSASRTSEQRA